MRAWTSLDEARDLRFLHALRVSLLVMTPVCQGSMTLCTQGTLQAPACPLGRSTQPLSVSSRGDSWLQKVISELSGRTKAR